MSCEYVFETVSCTLGQSGSVQLDRNGDRIANYKVWHLPYNGNEYLELSTIQLNPVNGSNVSTSFIMLLHSLAI